MLSSLNDLDGDVVTNAEVQTCWHGYSRQADLALIRVVRRANDLEWWYNWMRHVWCSQVAWTIDADVDVDQCVLVTREPARLEADSTTRHWP